MSDSLSTDGVSHEEWDDPVYKHVNGLLRDQNRELLKPHFAFLKVSLFHLFYYVIEYPSFAIIFTLFLLFLTLS